MVFWKGTFGPGSAFLRSVRVRFHSDISRHRDYAL
jgi:hypothetical protein